MKLALLLLVLLLVACHEDSGPCTCTPANLVRTKAGELVPMLRRHCQLLADSASHRDVKMVDDEIRTITTELCQPCGAWVGDRLTIEEMFPLARLDDATGAVCLGLTLRDGTTAFGGERPAACR